MTKISFEAIEERYDDLDDEFFHEAELLIILFNFHPGVQAKWLSKLGFKEKEIKIIQELSDLFNKRKAELVKDKKPDNRQEVILLENDVIEELYEPRLLDINKNSEAITKWIKKKHPTAVILKEEQLDELEDLMKLEGRTVDYLVFTPEKIYSYQLKE